MPEYVVSFNVKRVTQLVRSQHSTAPLWKFRRRERRFFREIEEPLR